MELTTKEQARLNALEEIIARGLSTFYEVGRALMEIRDTTLYKQTHSSFKAYCSERWEISESYATRMISASEVASQVLPIGKESDSPVITLSEFALRPLVDLNPSQRREIFEAALEEAKDDGGKLTSRHIEAAKEAIMGPETKHVVRKLIGSEASEEELREEFDATWNALVNKFIAQYHFSQRNKIGEMILEWANERKGLAA